MDCSVINTIVQMQRIVKILKEIWKIAILKKTHATLNQMVNHKATLNSEGCMISFYKQQSLIWTANNEFFQTKRLGLNGRLNLGSGVSWVEDALTNCLSSKSNIYFFQFWTTVLRFMEVAWKAWKLMTNNAQSMENLAIANLTNATTLADLMIIIPIISILLKRVCHFSLWS